jgi:very-short-patch-repair endonuclease
LWGEDNGGVLPKPCIMQNQHKNTDAFNLNAAIKNSSSVEGLRQTGVEHYHPVESLQPQSDGLLKRATKNYLSLPYNPKLKKFAKKLRKAGNLSEVLFWNQVKNKQFKGFDFDRQKIIGNYIVDFYCSNCNVVIEIDGSSHDNKQEYDAVRNCYLESLGLTVIHIPVKEVFQDMNALMVMLFHHPALSGTPPMEGKFEQ